MSDTTSTTLTFEVDRSSGFPVVRCHGKLVAGVSDMFYGQIHQLIPGAKRIVLDLSDLTRVDSMGLGALVRLYISAKSAGCRLELVNLGKQIRDLLGITNLCSVFADIGECGTKIV